MKRDLKREQTLQLLLSTTRQLVEEKGCVKTTFSDIMERSGLSKGAIFHYVKGKDDLLGLVLQSRIEETDERFFAMIDGGRRDFEGPMSEIAAGLREQTEPGDIANVIFRYLLGRSDEPGVSEILSRYYERSVEMSAAWIEAGQSHGVIPHAVDARKVAELFVLLTFGLRMRSGVAAVPHALTTQDVEAFIRSTLQSKSTDE